MAKTVAGGFVEFLRRLTPTGGESQAAKEHRASIEACLKKSLGMVEFFRTGSFGNGTSIRGWSDVDYFASIPTWNLSAKSSRALQQVREALDTCFPNSGVTVRTPAVLVPFGADGSESTEVVPAKYVEKDTNGHRIFKIADGSGGWTKSSPDAHNAYIAKIDGRLGNRVKPLVRFIKAWKYYQNVPVSSFYLELQVAKYASGEDTIVYPIDVWNVLARLYRGKLAAMQDPAGVSGYLYACASGAKKKEALSKLKMAVIRAKHAREEESSERIGHAFRWWNHLFGGHFPSYG